MWIDGEDVLLAFWSNMPGGESNVPVGVSDVPVGVSNVPVGVSDVPVCALDVPCKTTIVSSLVIVLFVGSNDLSSSNVSERSEVVPLTEIDGAVPKPGWGKGHKSSS